MPAQGSSRTPTTSRSIGPATSTSPMARTTGSRCSPPVGIPAPVRHARVRRGRTDIANAVAVDAAGNVYVADRGNARVMMFNSAGSFVKGWGWGVDSAADAFQTCTAASLCEIGTSVDSRTESRRVLHVPQAIAVDAGGDVYVSEPPAASRSSGTDPAADRQLLHRLGRARHPARPVRPAVRPGARLDGVQHLRRRARELPRPEVHHDRQLPPDDRLARLRPRAAERGRGRGGGPGGNVWVAESTNRRISKFTPGGAFLGSYTGYKPGNGAFSPSAIIFGPAGRPLRARLCLRPDFPASTGFGSPPPRPELGKLVRLDVVKGKVFVKVPAGSARASGSAAQGRRIRPADRGADGSRPLDPRHHSRHGEAHARRATRRARPSRASSPPASSRCSSRASAARRA